MNNMLTEIVKNLKRIAIIGNGGGGKTTLAKSLAAKYSLPLTHVDSIQYLAGMKIRDTLETTRILNLKADEDSWLIDGFGTYEVMQRRFHLADKIIFVDFPIWRHYLWCTKRQIKSLWTPRLELPANCNEATLSYTIKLYKILWRVHTQIRPKLIDLFKQIEFKNKVIKIKNVKQWNCVFFSGDI